MGVQWAHLLLHRRGFETRRALVAVTVRASHEHSEQGVGQGHRVGCPEAFSTPGVADDVVIFCHTDKDELRDILELFGHASGCE
jgi:hypothetical protein